MPRSGKPLAQRLGLRCVLACHPPASPMISHFADRLVASFQFCGDPRPPLARASAPLCSWQADVCCNFCRPMGGAAKTALASPVYSDPVRTESRCTAPWPTQPCSRTNNSHSRCLALFPAGPHTHPRRQDGFCRYRCGLVQCASGVSSMGYRIRF